jgi:hypothetical protein
VFIHCTIAFNCNASVKYQAEKMLHLISVLNFNA